MFVKSLTVTELNQYVKKIMENDFILRNILVQGEISNCKVHTSGHAYFSLKDSGGKINCVMFRNDLSQVSFEPENGMKVKVKGRVSLYEKEGKYQFYIREMAREGEGELFLEFTKLKKKLQEQGLFDQGYKKMIPESARTIGVVTSDTSAAVQDVITVATRRDKGINLIISPCLVQGEKAPDSIIKAIDKLECMKEVEVIIITRGGGSIEELWAFNDEKLARRIFKCKKPVVSAVGHETDFTICDFVSDLRVSTPSAAAEVVVCDTSKYIAQLNEIMLRLDSGIEYAIDKRINDIRIIHERLQGFSPIRKIDNEIKDVKRYKEMLINRINYRLRMESDELKNAFALLESFNPLNVLRKGYSIIQNEEGEAIKNQDQINDDDEYRIILSKEEIHAKILKIN